MKNDQSLKLDDQTICTHFSPYTKKLSYQTKCINTNTVLNLAGTTKNLQIVVKHSK